MITPPNHSKFKALPLAKDIDTEIIDCALAFIEPGGGGPSPDHTHPHDHLFTVVSGEVQVHINGQRHLITSGCSLRVPGSKLHSVWNCGSQPAKVIGTSLRPQ